MGLKPMGLSAGPAVFAAFLGWAVVATAVLAAAQSARAAEEGRPWIDELRAGGAVSVDTGSPHTAYAHLEALFSPLQPGPTYAPSWLLSPRPLLGANISAQGKTSELFGGLTWSAPVPGPFLLEASFGGTVHDQKLFVVYPDRPELTTRFLFRESIALGLQINPLWRILVFADHDSDGNLGVLNHGMDHVGVELGAKFGDPVAEPASSIPAPPFSWSGPYVGINFGVANGGAPLAVTIPPSTEGTVNSPPSGSLIIGGQIGYNWLIGIFLAGVEADISAQNLDTGTQPNTPGFYAVSAATRWLATGRLRSGVNLTQLPFVKEVLIYGTGGAAFAGVSTDYCLDAPTCFVNGMKASGWSTQSRIGNGWTAGGGIELPLSPSVTTKFEYLFADLDAVSFQQGPGTYAPKFTEHIVRGGVNFRFAGN